MNLDLIEDELSRRIDTQHQQAEVCGNKTGTQKHRVRAQALSEFLAWFRFQRKLNP